MIACICRNIHEEDYRDDESLRLRIMEDDWRCGQCQLRYEVAFISRDTAMALNIPTSEE